MAPIVIANRYEVQQELGEGGAAEVFKALDTRLRRVVAIKLLLKKYSEDTNFIKRFEQEAQAIAGLSHPNIVNVHDFDQWNGRYFIAMEFVPGGSFREYLKARPPLSEDDTRYFVTQILHGLAAAHETGLVHRDMKPENVLMARNGQLKISDFGIAKALRDTRLTRTGTVFGTAQYMAPEQARGQAVTPRSDLYAVGVMLYEMLSGSAPFADTDPLRVMFAHVHDMPRPLREVAPGVSPEMERVVMTALAKDPAQRFPDASEMLRALGGTAPPGATTAPAVMIPNMPGAGASSPFTPPPAPADGRQADTVIAGAAPLPHRQPPPTTPDIAPGGQAPTPPDHATSMAPQGAWQPAVAAPKRGGGSGKLAAAIAGIIAMLLVAGIGASVILNRDGDGTQQRQGAGNPPAGAGTATIGSGGANAGVTSATVGPTSAGAEVNVVVGNYAVRSDGGSSHVIGHVQNKGPEPVKRVRMIAALLNEEGNVVAVGESPSYVQRVVPPGMSSPFSVSLKPGDLPPYKDVRLQVQAERLEADDSEAENVAQGLQIVSNSLQPPKNEFSPVTILGDIKNNGAKTADYPEITALAYDAQGKPLAVASGTAKITELKPGEVSPFTIDFYDVEGIAKYDLFVEASVGE